MTQHKNQHELPLDGSIIEAAAAVSDLAALSARVIDEGLVREFRPVFVFDKNLAKNKSGNAARQAKFREKKIAQGLVSAQIPFHISEKLKEFGGDWSKLTHEIVRNIEVPGPVQYVEKLVTVPGPIQYVEKIVEKIVEKPVNKLTFEQRKTLELGEKVQKLSGFKRYLVLKIIS